MVKLYVDLINKGLWTLDKVPAIWHDKVAAELEKQNSQEAAE